MAIPVVSPMSIADLDGALEIEHHAFKQPWSRHMYVTDLLHNRLASYLVLRPAPADGRALPRVLAYGGFWLMVDEAHIATIASHPDWRGCGLGQMLMLALLDEALARGATRSTLEVRVTNHTARRLYEKLGYEEAGLRRRYYQDGEDALIMTTPSLREPSIQERLATARAGALARLGGCFDREVGQTDG